MKSSISSIVGGTMACALAGALAFSLASCEQKPSAEKFGREIDRAVDKAGNEIGKAADAADRKIELAKSTITGTAADAAKAVADKTAETAKSVAEKTAETAKAVDELVLGSRLKAALIAQPGVKITAIDINGGTVKLFGTADSSAVRDKASQIATGIDGVKSVNNYLVVIPKQS